MENNCILKNKGIIVFDDHKDWIIGKKFFKNGNVLTIAIKSDKRELFARLSNKQENVLDKYSCTVQHIYSKHGLKNVEYSSQFVIDLLEKYNPRHNLRRTKCEHNLFDDKSFGCF